MQNRCKSRYGWCLFGIPSNALTPGFDVVWPCQPTTTASGFGELPSPGGYERLDLSAVLQSTLGKSALQSHLRLAAQGGKPNGRHMPGVDRPAVPSLFQLMSNNSSQWCTQPLAAAKLHVSERTLIRWRSSKFLVLGKHWRRALPSPHARVLYNVEQCEKDVAKACSREASMLEQDIHPAR